MDRYKVSCWEGAMSGVGLQAFLNLHSSQGWQFVGTVSARATQSEPFRVLVIFERT